jgi:hypothetical protein
MRGCDNAPNGTVAECFGSDAAPIDAPSLLEAGTESIWNGRFSSFVADPTSPRFRASDLAHPVVRPRLSPRPRTRQSTRRTGSSRFRQNVATTGIVSQVFCCSKWQVKYQTWGRRIKHIEGQRLPCYVELAWTLFSALPRTKKIAEDDFNVLRDSCFGAYNLTASWPPVSWPSVSSPWAWPLPSSFRFPCPRSASKHRWN